MMKKFLLASVMLLFSMGWAHGATIPVTPVDVPPTWGSADNSGGGSSTITGNLPDANGGAGSLELRGDGTRFYYKNNPWETDLSKGIAPLNQVSSFNFSWAIASDSVSSLHPNYTPALRLHIYDPNGPAQRDNNLELIWEGAYNGVYGASLVPGQWYQSGGDDLFWRYEGAVTLSPTGAQVNQSIADWADPEWFTDAAMVMAISVGAGSSVGSDYHAYADYVNLELKDGTIMTWDFEPGTPVPLPGALVFMASGLLGLVGVSRKK